MRRLRLPSTAALLRRKYTHYIRVQSAQCLRKRVDALQRTSQRALFAISIRPRRFPPPPGSVFRGRLQHAKMQLKP